MSLGIPGITPGLAGLGNLANPLRPGVPRSSDSPSEAQPDLRGHDVAVPRAAAGPADIPPGTDPELWAVLTSEERTHFARLRSMGPLTYTTSTQAGSAPPGQARRGVRLDVRV